MEQSLVFLFVVVMFVLLMLSICVPLNYRANQTLEWAREIEERNGNPPKSGRVTMTEMVGEPTSLVACSSSTRVPITTSDVAPKITPSGVVLAPIAHYPDNRVPAAVAVAGFTKALEVLSEDSK